MKPQPVVQPSRPSSRLHLPCRRCVHLGRCPSCPGRLFLGCCPSCPGRLFISCCRCPGRSGRIVLSCCRRPGCPGRERLGRCTGLSKLHRRCSPRHERCRCRGRNRHCQQAGWFHLHRCRQQGHGSLGCGSCRSPRSRRLPLVSGGISTGPSLRSRVQLFSIFDPWAAHDGCWIHGRGYLHRIRGSRAVYVL